MHTVRTLATVALVFLGSSGPALDAQASASNCKAIHASMIERRQTTGCKPGHTSCFIGEVTGNHGLRGATYFRGDSSGTRPPTSPDFSPYSGVFEYQLEGGTLVMRETGVSNTTQGNLDSGAITAFQKVIEATGDLAGTTGYVFVNGFNRGGLVETMVTGELCRP